MRRELRVNAEFIVHILCVHSHRLPQLVLWKIKNSCKFLGFPSIKKWAPCYFHLKCGGLCDCLTNGIQFLGPGLKRLEEIYFLYLGTHLLRSQKSHKQILIYPEMATLKKPHLGTLVNSLRGAQSSIPLHQCGRGE